MSILTLGGTNLLLSANSAFVLKDFRICQNPYIFNSKDKIIKNFDVLFNFDNRDTRVDLLCEINHIPIIGSERFPKDIQYNILRKFGLNTPNFYTYFLNAGFDEQGRHDYLFALLSEVSDSTELILKDKDGARGLGQILLSSKDDLYNLLNERTDIEKIKNYKIGGSENEGDFKYTHIKSVLDSGKFFINEKVVISEEYRVLAFYNQTPIIIKRTVGKDWQSNISVTGEFETVSDLKVFPDDLLESINNFLKYLRTPFLSMDLYKDVSGKFGFFEFQMQYGYKAPNKYEIVNKSNLAVKALLKDIYGI